MLLHDACGSMSMLGAVWSMSDHIFLFEVGVEAGSALSDMIDLIRSPCHA